MASSRHGRFVLVALVIFVVVAGVGTFVLRPTFESRSAPPHKTAGALSAEPLSSNEIVDRLDPPEPMARTRGITIERTASTNTIELVTPQAGDQAGLMFDRADSGTPMPHVPGSTEATAPAPGSEPTPEAVPPASGPAVPPGTDSFQLDAQSFQPIPTDPDQLRAFVDELKASRDKGLLKPDIPAVMIADEKTRVTVTLSRGAAGAKVLQEPKLNLRNAGEIAASDFVSVQLDGGDAFDVKAVMPDRPQDLRTRDTGEWDFWVTPLAGGTHEIQIIVLLYDNIGYLPAAKFAKSVTVTVPFLSQITKFVQGWPSEFALLLIAGAGSILLAGWWDRRSKRSKMASAKRAEGQEIPPPPAKD